jgi:hypothetical protein
MRVALIVAVLSTVLAAVGGAVAAPLITRSQATQIARSSNLRTSDVPGYQQAPNSNPAGEDIWGGRRYARCANRKAYGKPLADVLSPSFERTVPGQSDALGSEVEVMPKESLAASDIAIAKSALGQRCMKREMLRLRPNGVALQNFTTNRLSGFNSGVAYRIKMAITSQGISFPIYADLFVFAEREVEGAAFFISGPKPPKRADENHLVNQVLTRVDKQVYKNEIF